MSARGDINVQIAAFTAQLQRREIVGSRAVALATANLISRFVSSRRWPTADDLITQVRRLGRELERAQPHEFACGNVIRRVLKSIRTVDENVDVVEDTSGDRERRSSMFGILKVPATEDKMGDHMRSRDLKAAVIEDIQVLIEEIGNEEPLQRVGIEMINDNDVILTPCPRSATLLEFFLKVGQKRNFEVIVTESYPNGVADAKRFAEELTKAGIHTQVLPDAAVNAVMSKVSKVIISPRTVLANGGLIASSGMALPCLAAKNFNKPVLVFAGSYKLSLLYPFDVETLIEVGNSGKVIDFADAELMDRLEVANPLCDYLGPELLDIIITTDGGHSPNFMYRIVLDNYSAQDQIL